MTTTTTPETKKKLLPTCICIGNSHSQDKTPSYQTVYQFIPTNNNIVITGGDPNGRHCDYDCVVVDDDDGIISEQRTLEDTATFAATVVTSRLLDDAILSCLAVQNVTPIVVTDIATDDVHHVDGGTLDKSDQDLTLHPAIQIYPSDDAHLLRCRPTNIIDGECTILGISESHSSATTLKCGESQKDDANSIRKDVPVHVTIWEPSIDERREGCCCQHPRGDWTRLEKNNNVPPDAKNFGKYEKTTKKKSIHVASLSIIDFTRIQDWRREDATIKNNKVISFPCIDTPGKVFHFLRSIQNCINHGEGLHCTSPWNRNAIGEDEYYDASSDHVLSVLVNDPSTANEEHNITGSSASDDIFWSDFENSEIDQLLQFRTGDATPSYFLYSVSRLDGNLITKLKEPLSARFDDKYLSQSTLLLVYRPLPPRDILAPHSFSDQEIICKGCLVESYLDDSKNTKHAVSIDDNNLSEISRIVKQRLVSPPYLSHAQEYPDTLDILVKNIDVLQKEAQIIPQWTAWPEKNHYAGNAWNVFPLCYTFPANDVTKRKFIDHTCSHVPKTTKLLHTLGPALRTALFSRLDAGSQLEAHTGWEDLANHVLRVHIPLIVPGKNCVSDDNYNAGLCGVWVDGCVNTHEEGRIIVFDDSKVHRAFNYSDGERIVLIIDLARPDNLPVGTATGGHSDELDDFINAF